MKNIVKNKFYLISLLLLLGMSDSVRAQIQAFPGAEGFGMHATGGRGGRVIEVTTLADRDRYGTVAPGSFREALSTSGDDPICIVFRVSGIIELYGELKSSRSNMTIAGQTAPGDGICIKDASIKLSGSNLIIRYLRFRPGDETKEQVSGLNIENAGNFIIDHCSFSWSIEENATFYDNKYTTVQWCIISESLYSSYHSKGPRGYAGQWGGQYASYHHNLIASNKSRSPRINGCRAHDTIALNDFRNNVVFNWGTSGAIYGGEVEIYWDDPEKPGTNKAGSFNNFVNNYYKKGPATSGSIFAAPSYVTEGDVAQGYAEWYFNGNFMEGDAAKTADNWSGVLTGSIPGGADSIRVLEEHPVNNNILTHTAEEAYPLVLVGAGAIKPRRDQVDTRIVNQVQGLTQIDGAGIIDSQTEVGGWPNYNTAEEAKIPVDTDHDGMPDTWEDSNGLDKNNADDGKALADDGYSNLEHYLNSDIPYLSTAISPILDKIQHIEIYPNPVSVHLNFNPDNKYTMAEIYTVNGAKVLRKGLLEMESSLNIGQLENGIYLVTFTNINGKSNTQKFFKE